MAAPTASVARVTHPPHLDQTRDSYEAVTVDYAELRDDQRDGKPLDRDGGALRWETTGNVIPMEATLDAVGRIVVPKALRDALGLRAGSTVDISRYGSGLQLVPTGRTARLVDESGALVATGETTIDDDVVFGLIDSGRR